MAYTDNRILNKAIELAESFGYMTKAEVILLASLAEKASRKSHNSPKPFLINIGAGSGTSALAMRAGAPQAHIYTIDKSMGGPLGGLENERNAFYDLGLVPPTQILGTSHDVAKIWTNVVSLSADMVFVDDGHEPEDIYWDSITWPYCLHSYGIIAFHDYGSNDWPAVKEAVDRSTERLDHNIGFVDTLIAFQYWEFLLDKLNG